MALLANSNRSSHQLYEQNAKHHSHMHQHERTTSAPRYHTKQISTSEIRNDLEMVEYLIANLTH